MHTIPERDRWLALGLLLAVVGVVYLAVVHPWWTRPMLEFDRSIEAIQQRELRARMQLKQRNTVERQLLAARRLESREPVFLHEASVELATAALAKRIETAVAQASPGNSACAIGNRAPGVPGGSAERFERVVVRVRMRCGNGELAKVLHALESGSPALFVEHFNVTGLDRHSAAPAAGAGGLDVEFELHGFLQPVMPRGGVDAP